MTAARDLLVQAWQSLGGPVPLTERVTFTGPPDTLPSPLAVTALAQATAGAAGLAAAELAVARGVREMPGVTVDSRAAAVAFTSERHLRVDGQPLDAWDALSGFWPTADGWVRTHANYPHHRARLLAALGIPPDAPDLREALGNVLAAASAQQVEDAVAAAGGVTVAVRTPAQWAAHQQARALRGVPLTTVSGTGPGSRQALRPAPADPLLPAAGVKVLDLTRVIAGPVAGRTLALLGADVLRVDSPRLPELPAQHLDTGLGKRSTLLDLADPADRDRMAALLADADVVVTGYRPGALDRFGLTPAVLADRHPGIVTASLSAWGEAGPWSGRRGFDSLVQAATGIAVLASAGGDRPGVLPAQALDHATGYLLAAGVLRALARRQEDGLGGHVQLSLARTGAWLQEVSRPAGPEPAGPAGPPEWDPSPWLDEADTPAGRLRYALPPFALAGGPRTWSLRGGTWGTDSPGWR